MGFELSKLDKIVEKAHKRLDAFAQSIESSLMEEEIALSPEEIE